MNNLEIIQHAYKSFAEGNIEGVTAYFDPDIEWNECQGFPYIEGDGIFKGPDAILQNIFAQIPVQFDGFHINMKEIFGVKDKVVMVGYYEGIYKASGKQFKANATHVWTLKDEKIINFFQAVDTATIVR